jgi:hypothetical protein
VSPEEDGNGGVGDGLDPLALPQLVRDHLRQHLVQQPAPPPDYVSIWYSSLPYHPIMSSRTCVWYVAQQPHVRLAHATGTQQPHVRLIQQPHVRLVQQPHIHLVQQPHVRLVHASGKQQNMRLAQPPAPSCEST